MVGQQKGARIVEPDQMARESDVLIKQDLLIQTHQAVRKDSWKGQWDNSRNRILQIHQLLAPATAFLRDALQIKIQEERDFRNEAKVGLCSLPNSNLIAFKRIDFYTAFLTNGLYRDRLIYTLNKTDLPPIQIIPTDWAKIDLSTSQLANNIGITILVIDCEGNLLLGRHNKKAQAEVNALVPLGNGSLDIRDLAITSNGQVDILKTIVTGSTREFIEESLNHRTHPRSKSNDRLRYDVCREVADEAKYLGFWQWVSQGYKPEFVCLSRTTRLRDTFRASTDELTIDTSGVFPAIKSFYDIDKVSIWAQKNPNDLSVPLFAAIQLLASHSTNPSIHEAISAAWNI
jgi:hypothetical protein